MLIKTSVCLLGSLAESLTKDVLAGQISKKASYKKRTAKMVELGMIDKHMQNQLDWLWDTRNREHLFLLDSPEYGHYKMDDYEKASKTIATLTKNLDAYFRNLETPF
jgi:NAD-dependent SIR2 family protein deacetylase